MDRQREGRKGGEKEGGRDGTLREGGASKEKSEEPGT